jgi:hypothetical protein
MREIYQGRSGVTLLTCQQTRYVVSHWTASTKRKVAEHALLLVHVRISLRQTQLFLTLLRAFVTLDSMAQSVRLTLTNALQPHVTMAVYARIAVPQMPQYQRTASDVYVRQDGKGHIVTTMWTNAKPHRAGTAHASIRLQTRHAMPARHYLLTN